MLQCYICHKPIKRHEYTRHVASHLASGVNARPDPTFPSRARNLQEHADNHNRETPKGQSVPPSTFQTWLEKYAHGFAKYTTIDGRKKNPDMEIIHTAGILRFTTKDKIIGIVKEFKGFSDDDNQKTCLELVRKAPIFPGLVAYTYTHLIMCPSPGWLGYVPWSNQVSMLKQLVERWSKYDRPRCILSCDEIKDALLKILRATQVGSKDHKCNSALLDGTTVLKYDILNLAALTVLCITGKRKEDIFGRYGGEAGKFIDLFHALLESNVELEDCYRRSFLNVIIPFSKEYRRCPHGFYITEGNISGLQRKNAGGFGEVYRGKFGSRLVAVKALKRRATSSDYTKRISQEAIVWWYLQHPNCLPLYGVYIMDAGGQDASIAFVSPWMEQGTLSDYLERFPSANRTKLILDVVRGLNYLHTMKPHVAHRDIKSDNILITRKGNACLADFGLASVFDTTGDLHPAASKAGMGGTLHYMAPEILTAKTGKERRWVNKRACDMYALGCTIYATYTGKPPFRGMTRKDLFDNVTSGRRPGFPEGKMPHDMWCFVEKLWHSEPSKRLTAEMALDWMKVKASQEGVGPSLEPVGEREWERKKSSHLWSVRP